jgi:fibrillarin-like rRNA methylase
MGKNDQKELRIKNAESFLKENGALIAIIGTSINIRQLPIKILNSLLKGVEACKEDSKINGVNTQRKYNTH